MKACGLAISTCSSAHRNMSISIIHTHTEISPDLTLLYGCIHIWWKTVSEESKLIFYEEEREIYNVTVRGVNYYRFKTDSEWLKGVSDKSDITVEVTVETILYWITFTGGPGNGSRNTHVKLLICLLLLSRTTLLTLCTKENFRRSWHHMLRVNTNLSSKKGHSSLSVISDSIVLLWNTHKVK